MLVFAILLLAAEPTSPAYDACLNAGDAANGVQSAMQACADAEFYRQDALLNSTYRAKMAVLPATRQVILRSAQRQWIVARDRRCKSRSTGTMAAFETVDCMATQTASRTLWLGRYR